MINAAIVGLGRWGRILVESVQGKSGAIRFAHAVTRTPERAADFCQRHGLTVSSDMASALADPSIGIVVLATPHSQHAAQIESATAAGKHVLVEKPMTLTVDSARKAADAAHRAGVLLAVGYNRRFLPTMLELRRRVAGGALGTVLHIEANYSMPSGYRYQAGGWRADPGESPLGGMTGMGLHMIDAMISLLGPVRRVYAQRQRRVLDLPIDDTTALLLTFRDGAMGYLGTMIATAPIWRFQVIGAKGWGEARNESQLEIASIEGGRECITPAAADIQCAELEAFARAVTGAALYPVPLNDAIHGVEILEAACRSAALGQAVDLPSCAASNRWTAICP